MAAPHGETPRHAGFGLELVIDWLSAAEIGDGLPGDLGLTVLPGKRGASQRYPGHTYRRDLAVDLAALRAGGIGRLVLLVEDDELHRWSDPRIVECGRAAGLEVIRHPLADGRAPSSAAAMDAILDDIDAGRRRRKVAVACMGGVGRTGTVAACLLVRAGRTPRDAIERVRAVRHPTAVETPEQERFVRAYARR